MKLEDYRKKTNDELQKELEALVKERFNLRIQRGSGLNPKPHLFSLNKKNCWLKTLSIICSVCVCSYLIGMFRLIKNFYP